MKKSVVYGAGNIGRGFIGQLFSESGYEVVFIDINQELVDRLNSNGKYPVQILDPRENKEFYVENVRAVNGRCLSVSAEEISNADIMATSVGVNILPEIAKTIAAGLKKRWRDGNTEPLNIIICENLIGANRLLAQWIGNDLDTSEKKLLSERVGFVEASVGRMVPVMTDQMRRGNIARVCVEEYCELPVDKDGFKGSIPDIKHMIPFSPFSFYIQRKLFIHNMGHALVAYLGKLKGYIFIWQAIGDPHIRLTVMKAMQNSAVSLSREHKVPLDTILAYIDDLVYRFGNKLLEDTINRVGHDVKRKLSASDRLTGAARLCMNHGIFPSNICLGIAAAMHFDRNIQKERPERILEEICLMQQGDPLKEKILEFYQQIENRVNINRMMEEAWDFNQAKAVC